MLVYRGAFYRRAKESHMQPTPEMEEFFETRTAEHIARVQNYLENLIGFPGLAEDDLIRRGEEHDADKYDMRLPYIWVTEYHRAKNDGEDISAELQAQYDLAREATGQHVQDNWHHPEAHDSPEDMDDLDLAEMVADWFAMGEELGTDARDWADENIGSKWAFSPAQEDTIYEMIEWLE